MKVCFTIYGNVGLLGHVTQIPRTNICSLTHELSNYNLASIGQAVLKMLENYGIIHVHEYSPEAGVDNPQGSIF